MVHLSWGLLGAAVGTVGKKKDKAGEDEDVSTKRLFLALAVSAIQGVVLFVVLCPVAILYVFGLGISAGASLWRLIKHDFGDDGGANKKPALQVLYSLAVAQGVLFGYKIIHALAAKGGLVKFVYNRLGKKVQEKLVAEYLEETVAGCEKDPSFATGRNLVTYGVDLMMEAKSSEGFIAGIKVLDGAINDGYPPGQKVLAKYLLTRSDDSSTSIVQRLLETVGSRSPYSREIKEHVVSILDIIGPCIRLEQFPRAIEYLCSVVDTSEDSSQILGKYKDKSTGIGREKVGDYERMELLELSEYLYVKYDRKENGSPDFSLGSLWEVLCQCLPWKRKNVENERKENIIRGFDQMLIKATNIIHMLVALEDDIRIMRTCVLSNTMLHKIAKFPTKLHRENHDPCYGDEDSEELQMLEQCWVLTGRLFVALKETSRLPLLPVATPVGESRQRRNEEIEETEAEQLLVLRAMDDSALGSSIKGTIKHSIQSTIKCIFDCLDCSATQKRRAIQILLHLSLDISFIIDKDSETSSKRRLRWILLLILCNYGGGEYFWKAPSLPARYIVELAGNKLSEMLRENHGLPSEEIAYDANEQLVGLALEELKRAFYDCAEDTSDRTHAIIIMENLYYLSYNPYSEVEGFLVHAIPEVIKETLIRCRSVTTGRQEQTTDVEKGNNVSQDNQDGCKDSERLQKVLLSVCHSGFRCPTWQDKFVGTASEICKEPVKSYEDFIRFVRQSDK